LHVQESLTKALGRTPTTDEVAESLGVDRKSAAEALADASRTVTALDATEGDVIAANVASPEDAVLDTERSRYVAAAVRSLPERMRYVIEQIYFHDRSVGELAAELGLTHSAVSQQRTEAVRLMRDGLEAHYSQRPAEGAHSRVAPARRAAYLARLAETATAAMTVRSSAPQLLSRTAS
jgi:RNA polymerase sigma factor for flagellar operon FliA